VGSALEVLRTAFLNSATNDALIDISIPYSPHIPVWPGDVPFSCGWTARREAGSSVNLGVMHSSVHAGTHADAPLHVDSTWSASESLPIEAFVGDALVIALAEGGDAESGISVALLMEAMMLAGVPGDVVAHAGLHHLFPKRVMCCTGFSVANGAFPDAWPALTDDAVTWLMERNVLLWGTDAPSVDSRISKALPVHHALFAGSAHVLENLSLRCVAPGAYELLAQPLAIVGADAAPVRALLRTPSTAD